MHQLIATYLFQHKQCPLPNFGHLYVSDTAVQTDFVNKQIYASKPSIQFSNAEIDSENFINYIATQTNTLVENASQQINTFLQRLFSSTQNKINGVGIFSKQDDVINFEPLLFNTALIPPAKAERVIHEAATHNMLVGDKETTTTQMTEYFSDEVAPKERWWIWAVALAAVGLAVIAFYYFVDNQF